MCSIDAGGNVKIWDVRLLICLQTIVPSTGTELQCGLVGVTQEMFITYGLRFKIASVSETYMKK